MSLSDFYIVEKQPPHDKDTWVKIIAHIRDNTNNKIKLYTTESIWDFDNNEPHTYIWQDGNYSCDCNRHLFFYDDWGGECGDGGFSVNLQNPKTGEYFYKEFD